MLCYAMLCYAMLCYAVLCCAVLCYAMLCYAMLHVCYADGVAVQMVWCTVVGRALSEARLAKLERELLPSVPGNGSTKKHTRSVSFGGELER
jgi:hypothetical protein